MEKQMRPYRKINPFFKTTQEFTPFNHFEEEHTKNALIDIAQAEQSVPLQNRPLNLEAWTTAHHISVSEEEPKPVIRFRKSMVLRTNLVSRQKIERSTKDQKGRKSIIPRLKNLLQRLQSPDKTKLHQNKQIQIFPQKQSQWMERLTSKKASNSIRITNYSSEKKTRKIPIIKDKSELMFNRQPRKQYDEHLNQVRQARRKRTLRNLLF